MSEKPKRKQQAAPIAGGREAHGGNRGGTDAPPGNTAPDNCNLSCQFLRWGIDSLYLSYPGELAEASESVLKKLKLRAQGPEHEAAEAQIQLGSHVFEVRDKSSGLFAFTLVDGSYMIRVSARRSKKLPMAYVQVSSHVLSYMSPMDIERELRAILAELGNVDAPKVSRVDLFLDFASSMNMENWGREAWVTRAHGVSQYAQDQVFTGWSIGEGGALMARLYHKVLEVDKSGKTYLFGLWREAGWDGVMPVWRLEFEFRRDILTQLQLDGLPSVLGALDGLWSYATTEWLKLTIPSASDQTRSRWLIHPLWMLLADVDWGVPGGPLLRHYTPVRAPGRDWLGARGLSLLASVAAIAGVDDPDKAGDLLLDWISHALGNRYGVSGISLKQGFAEMVAANTRKYNLRLNAQTDEEPQPDDPRFRNEYYRQSKGF